MSILDRATVTKGNKAAPKPATTVSGLFFFRSTLPQEKEKQFTRISVVPLANMTVPYLFKTGSAMNAVQETDTFDDMLIEAGKETWIVSISRRLPPNVVPNTVIRLMGLHFTAYRPVADPSRPVRFQLGVTDALVVQRLVIFDLIRSIPPENQALDIDRDAYIPGMAQTGNSPYTFFTVRVVPTGAQIPDNDGLAYGRFMVADPRNTTMYTFTPFSAKQGVAAERPTFALTGGSMQNGQGTADIELSVGQNSKGDRPAVLLSARTRLYEESIARFQVGELWPQLGPVFLPRMEGLALCVVDPKKTPGQLLDEQSTYDAAISCTATFFPDLGRMARTCGVRCTREQYAEVCQMVRDSPTKGMPATLTDQLTGINMLTFEGDKQRLLQAVDEKQLELYVVSNMSKTGLSTAQKDPSQLIALLKDDDLFDYARAIAVYAVTAPDCSEHIEDFKAYNNKAAPIDLRNGTKRVRVGNEA